MQPAYTKPSCLFVLLLLFPLLHLEAQESKVMESAREFQEKLNRDFYNAETSPLSEEDREGFQGLVFFPFDTAFSVEADFVRTPNATPFEMPTTTERKPLYIKYGEVHFRLKGREYKLDLFQSLDLSDDPEYFDYLFVPFTDRTNGRSTYGGGRYLDLRIPNSNKITLDFNKAYNPYCAYNAKYSCPIPPEQNNLDLEIRAGVMALKE